MGQAQQGFINILVKPLVVAAIAAVPKVQDIYMENIAENLRFWEHTSEENLWSLLQLSYAQRTRRRNSTAKRDPLRMRRLGSVDDRPGVVANAAN